MAIPSRPLAIVTGAASGLGLDLAKHYAANNFDLLIVADEPEIHDVAQILLSYAVNVDALEADLTTERGVDELYEAVAGRPVAALVANAGLGLEHAFLDQSFEGMRRAIDTNVTGTMYLLQRFGRDMRERGEGRILMTGSIAGEVPGGLQTVLMDGAPAHAASH